jgi:anaphase-promoting complex subunit 2
MSGATNRRRILSTVFPVSVYASSQPTPRATPQATPETRFPQPGQPFGGYHHGDPAGFTEPSSDPVVRQINWERAWHSATSFLRIPAKFDLSPRPGAANQLHREWLRCHPSESPSAIPNLLRPEFSPTAREDECFDTTLVTWYGSEVRRHFLAQILPQVRQVMFDLSPSPAGLSNEEIVSCGRVQRICSLHGHPDTQRCSHSIQLSTREVHPSRAPTNNGFLYK